MVPTKGLAKEVYEILVSDERARNSDNVLYFDLLKARGKSDSSIQYVLFSGECPHFESVRRTRQKIQSAFPELDGERVLEARLENEEKYKAFARLKNLFD